MANRRLSQNAIDRMFSGHIHGAHTATEVERAVKASGLLRSSAEIWGAGVKQHLEAMRIADMNARRSSNDSIHYIMQADIHAERARACAIYAATAARVEGLLK